MDAAEALYTVCSQLQAHDVEYLVVGGNAVNYHGYFRLSVNSSGKVVDKTDIDIWYNPTYDNYFRLLDAVEALGQDIARVRKEKTPNPKASFFRFETADFTLDFLPSLCAPVRFREAYQRREQTALSGVPVAFLGYEDLIFDKEANGREKDKADIEQLKKRREGK